MDSQTQTAPQVGTMPKADMGKRVVAYFTDMIGINVVAGILWAIPGLGEILGVALIVGYMLLRDGFDFEFMKQRSLGKQLMKIRPVRIDGQPMDLAASAQRNWILLIPFMPLIEIFMMMNDDRGLRIGDKIGNTMVIDSEN